MSLSGKARVRQAPHLSAESAQNGGLLRSDLLLKIEGGGVRRICGQDIADDLTRLGQTVCFDETARERDAEIVRVQRGDTAAKKVDRRIRVAKLARRFGRDRVITRDRREESDGLLLDRKSVV